MKRKQKIKQAIRDYRKNINIQQGIKDLPENLKEVKKKIPSTFRSVLSVFSPFETALAAKIKGIAPQEAIKEGTDISSALESQGVPSGVALPVGLMASAAIPGAGEMVTGRKMAEKVSNKALRLLSSEDIGIMDTFSDLIKAGRGRGAMGQLGKDAQRILEGLGGEPSIGNQRLKSFFEAITERYNKLVKK